jgi:LysM repeat protein
MIDPEQLELNQEIGLKVRSAFQIQDPDQSFIDCLQKELADRFKAPGGSTQGQNTFSRRSQWVDQTKHLVSPLAWGAIAIFLILSLIWGINTLIPRTIPGRNIVPSPSPLVSPSPQLPTLSAPSIENAISYTVEAGDTLSIIEEKTGVPMETLHNLNEFVLQLNHLAPGLQLVIGFEDQTPVFYTVQERDTIQGISDKAGISIEYFFALNRIGLYAPNIQTPLPVPQYKLTPGIRVIVGLENKAINDNKRNSGELLVLSEVDLNCDSHPERILGIETPEIEYFNIKPQLSTIILERNNGTGFERAWEQTAQEAGVSYLAYQLFQADNCNQFLVIIGHIGKEAVNVFRWDGERLISVLKLGGRFLFEGNWMEDVFGDYKTSQDTLFLGELQQITISSKNIWILRGYQWSDGVFKLVIEKRLELSAGG